MSEPEPEPPGENKQITERHYSITALHSRLQAYSIVLLLRSGQVRSGQEPLGTSYLYYCCE